MKQLGICLFAKVDIKRCIYYHSKKPVENPMLNDEDVNNFLNEIEYTHDGESVIYKLAEAKNEIIEIDQILNDTNSLTQNDKKLINQILNINILSSTISQIDNNDNIQ